MFQRPKTNRTESCFEFWAWLGSYNSDLVDLRKLAKILRKPRGSSCNNNLQGINIIALTQTNSWHALGVPDDSKICDQNSSAISGIPFRVFDRVQFVDQNFSGSHLHLTKKGQFWLHS